MNAIKSFLFGLIILLKDSTTIRAEVTLTPSTQNIAENSPVTLSCSYTGSLTVTTFTMTIPQSTGLEGSLLSDCSVFTKEPDPALYEYNCPTRKQLTWTIKNVTSANDGETWRCALGFTTPGIEMANITINVKVPINNVVMTNPTKDVITVQENTETVFVCRTSGGLPAATVRWFKDQNTTTTTDDVEITNFATTTSSVMNGLTSVTSALRYSPRRGDNGFEIYCSARNSANTLRSSRNPQLNVQYSTDGPPIIQNFNNGATFNVIENTQHTLSCSIVGGNPLATLSWTCFNSGFASTTTRSTVTKTVTFTASRRQDRSCKCQSSHPVTGTQSATVKIQVLYPPESPTFKVNGNMISSPVKFIMGKRRSIVCESNGKPSPNIYTWTKGGQNIRSEKTLTFDSIQRQNDSQYICTAGNTMIASDGSQRPGTNSSTVQITVLFPPTKPSLYFGGINGQLIQGDTIDVVRRDTFTVACKSEGQPNPSLKWTGQTSNSRILSISSINDNLSKTCTVTNTMRETHGEAEQGSASTTVTMNLLYRPSITSCQLMYTTGSPTHVTGSINVIENSSFTLTCSANSKPAANIYWPGTGISSSTLSVNRISRQQNGTYTIVAENTMTRTFGDAVTGRDTENFHLNVLYPPKLQTLNKLSKIVTGYRLNLSCAYEKGNPQETTFKWTRNDDNREWGNQVLYIENVTKHDDMVYTCTVKNVMTATGAQQEIGQDSKSFHLDVLYKASITSFVVQGNVDSSSFTVKENDPVPFVCTVDSNPNSNIEVKFQNEILKTLDNTDSLNFYHDAASCLDAGVYTCSAWNLYNLGKYSVRKLLLFVKCSPRPLVSVSENVTSAPRESVTLKFMGIAYPSPSFTWEKEEKNVWKRLSNSSDILISTSGVDTYLTIRNVSLGDYGNYQLKITNNIDEFIQPFHLIPEGIPETPSEFVALESDITDSSALLHWKPGFNGGPQQTFIIRYKKISDNSWLTTTVQDSGDTVMNHTVKRLTSDSEYQVVIFAQNRVGNSSRSRNATFITKIAVQMQDRAKGNAGTIIGGVMSGIILCIVIVIVGLLYFRRHLFNYKRSLNQSDDQASIRETNQDYVDLQNSPYVHTVPVYDSLKQQTDGSAVDSSHDTYTQLGSEGRTDEQHIYSKMRQQRDQGDEKMIYVNLDIKTF